APCRAHLHDRDDRGTLLPPRRPVFRGAARQLAARQRHRGRWREWRPRGLSRRLAAMRGRIAGWVAMLAGAAMALSAAAADRPNDVVRTWETAFVAVQIETPDLKRIELGGRIGADYIAEILQGMSPTLKQPVVIFISDCNYRSNDPEARQQIKFIASLGYIVFAPNSFARIGREPA